MRRARRNPRLLRGPLLGGQVNEAQLRRELAPPQTASVKIDDAPLLRECLVPDVHPRATLRAADVDTVEPSARARVDLFQPEKASELVKDRLEPRKFGFVGEFHQLILTERRSD